MTETFYGPWKIVLVHVNSHFSQSVEITGSDNADGRYDVAFGQPFELDVAGAEWQLELAYWPFGGVGGWQGSQTRRATEFRDPEGLVVQIDGDNSAAAHPDYDNLTLVCTSRDPAVNPNPTPNPYDFTYPHR
jgi:hypothetical protein